MDANMQNQALAQLETYFPYLNDENYQIAIDAIFGEFGIAIPIAGGTKGTKPDDGEEYNKPQ